MKSKITLLLFLLGITLLNAQKNTPQAKGGEFIFNPEKEACLEDYQREDIFRNIQSNVTILKEQRLLAFDELNRGSHPLFAWPLQKSASSTYNEIYGISGFVDHNTAYPNQLTDYNCGTRSYDTNTGYNHQGVDMFSWPFGWKMMDNDEVEIIAAAPGQIVAKGDGEFDRSCNFNSNPWNAVYVQHSDGSIAWYGHMKNGSTTSKNVGDMVVEGEYLGIVGSSGNSTGPHLHFEVYTDTSFSQLVDPYSGSCNSFNTDTWWASQKPYQDPGINAAITHNAPPNFNTCPTAETTNEINDFDTDDTIYFALYLKDQQAGTSVNLKIIRPDNSVLYNWNFQLTDTYAASYWYWYYSGVFDFNGEWKWQATYSGETVTHNFNVTGALNVDEQNIENTSIYPNPFNEVVMVNSRVKINQISVVDVLGKNILDFKDQSATGINEINLVNLSKGIYFVTLLAENNQKKTIKLIKN